ncbi:MAG: hypothetical protein HY318_11705 [Armatimonadetes bacterium]|nr:hypothetical protein [Armatimonadota bacterium]
MFTVANYRLVFALSGPAVFAFRAWAQPLLTAPFTSHVPVIDGRLEEDEWSDAAATTGFSALGPTKTMIADQPVLFCKRNSTHLFVAFRLPLPTGATPRAQVTQRDGPVWDDDAVEVFLDPAHGHGEYFQFIMNAEGIKWDSKNQYGKWNGDWEGRTSVTQTGWEAEMAIRIHCLGPLSDYGTLGFNAGWDRQTPTPLLSSWAVLPAGFHDPGHFGHLAFPSPLSDRPGALRLTKVTTRREEGVRVEGSFAAAKPFHATAMTYNLLHRETGKPDIVFSGETKVPPGPFCIAPAESGKTVPLMPGRYFLDLSFAGYASSNIVFEIPEPLVVTPQPYFLEGNVDVGISVEGMERPPQQVAATLSLHRANGEAIESREFASFSPDGKAKTSFNVRDLPPGEYQLRCEARWTKGDLVVKNTVPITKPETPDWLGSKEGLSDKVLPPWIPVKVEGTTISPWGRSYQMKGRPFPQTVVAAGKSLLAGPIRLLAMLNGKEHEFSGGASEVFSRKPGKVELRHKSNAGSLSLEETGAVEYDGMGRFDFSISAKHSVKLESLVLEIPFKPEHARYLYHFPGRWGSAYNAGALPRDGFTSGFRPYLWLGDEDRGLAWFTESDRNWFSKDPNQVVQIRREGNRVVLRLTIVDIPIEIPPNQPAVAQIANQQSKIDNLSYTFGFQATPVKPIKEDVWDYRIVHSGNYGIEKAGAVAPASLTYPARGNFNPKQGTLELWTRVEFDPNVPVAPDDPGRGQYNRSLFGVSFPDGDWINLYWNIDVRGLRFFVKKGQEYPLMLDSVQNWKKGELHHIAICWGDTARLFVDGKEVASRGFNGTLDKDLGSAVLEFGGGPCEFAVDEIRISDIARTPRDFERELIADEHTLLLEHLNESFQPDGGKQTLAAKIAPATKVSGGTPEGDACFAPVKFGNGVLLYHPGEPKTQLDRLAEEGVRTLVFHEHWTDIQNYTSTTHGENLRNLVKACHKRGIKLLLYFGYEVSDIAPEFSSYSDECLVYPRAGGYTRLPEQTAYIVCYRSKWQDFMAHGMAKMMDEYDIDGVYLDGTEFPWGCANRHHGCGYEKPDGTLGTTYPFFSTRDMMQRIYTLVKSRKSDGQVNVHNSTCMTAMTLSWATSTWDGEQFGGIERGPYALEVLPLDAFRCEFTGRQLGVPAEFLCYNRPYTMHEALTFTLLHDVLVRGAPEAPKLWKVMEGFGRKKAKFMPYWDNKGWVTTSDDTVKASVYSRGGKGAMLVVSNLGQDSREVVVTLNLGALGLPPKSQSIDVMTGYKVELTKGKLQLKLDSLDWRLMRVR